MLEIQIIIIPTRCERKGHDFCQVNGIKKGLDSRPARSKGQ